MITRIIISILLVIFTSYSYAYPIKVNFIGTVDEIDDLYGDGFYLPSDIFSGYFIYDSGVIITEGNELSPDPWYGNAISEVAAHFEEPRYSARFNSILDGTGASGEGSCGIETGSRRYSIQICTASDNPLPVRIGADVGIDEVLQVTPGILYIENYRGNFSPDIAEMTNEFYRQTWQFTYEWQILVDLFQYHEPQNGLSGTITSISVPKPLTLLLFLTGLVLFGARQLRR